MFLYPTDTALKGPVRLSFLLLLCICPKKRTQVFGLIIYPKKKKIIWTHAPVFQLLFYFLAIGELKDGVIVPQVLGSKPVTLDPLPFITIDNKKLVRVG